MRGLETPEEDFTVSGDPFFFFLAETSWSFASLSKLPLPSSSSSRRPLLPSPPRFLGFRVCSKVFKGIAGRGIEIHVCASDQLETLPPPTLPPL